MTIFGISGKRETGKSSLAKALVKNYGFIRLSLADPLKLMCQELYGLTDEQLFGSEKESPTKYRRSDGSFFTPRDILIREGCLKRSIDPNFWCKQLHEQLEFRTADATATQFVIDDIRFLNEIHYFKKLGAKFVRLERSERAIGKAALDDLSECELDGYKDWDAILLEPFNRDLDDLKNFAEYLVLNTARRECA